MCRQILDWKEFQKRMTSLVGIDIERVTVTEIQRGPIESVGYDFEGKISVRLKWLARLTENWRDGWREIEANPYDLELKIITIGLQIIEWDNGRISIDDPRNLLAPTYTFLVKEPQLGLGR